MTTLNFVGDFFVNKLNGLEFGPELKEILKSGDLNIVNFEGPIKELNATAISKSGPNIFQDDNCPIFLERNGFNIIQLANNHSIDYGTTSLQKTISSFKNSTTIGVGTFEDAYKTHIFNIDGLKIGLLSLSQYEFGIHDGNIYPKQELGVAWMLHPCIDEIIIEQKKICDYLIIIVHAGLEHFFQPLPELRTLYRHYINIGADAVVGGHPHVPQGTEYHRGKPIVYSLGNFCFDLETDAEMWFCGLLLTLQINNDIVSVKTRLLHYDIYKRIVEISSNKEYLEKYEEIQRILDDDLVYIDQVNKHCISMRRHYDMLLEMSGYYRAGIKKCLGVIKRIITGREPTYNKSHLLNCLRCETHRWVISRINELTQNK